MKINLTPILLAYDRLWQKRDTGCICPSHASNRGECPVHDDKGRVRGRAASNQDSTPASRLRICRNCGYPEGERVKAVGGNACDNFEPDDSFGASDPRPDPRTHPEYWAE